MARILVVEDDEDNRAVVVKTLAAAGHEVLEATDGRTALAMASAVRPDLIVMDLALPGMDGWETTRKLKANPVLADIPVVALTAFALRGDEERAREAGCDGYIPKPCRPATLRDAVKAHLERARTR